MADALMRFSCATFARKKPLSGSRSLPTIDRATWWCTPAAASAASRLRPDVSKNSRAALSSHTGAFATSTTTSAPSSALAKPSRVMVFTPVLGEAGSTSWPRSLRFFTSFVPMRPVPPMTTIFTASFRSFRPMQSMCIELAYALQGSPCSHLELLFRKAWLFVQGSCPIGIGRLNHALRYYQWTEAFASCPGQGAEALGQGGRRAVHVWRLRARPGTPGAHTSRESRAYRAAGLR